MSYQVLARKWRPQSFDAMVGQQHVIRALTHALEQQRLHHAYLFTGTRGVGKTTLGRLLAKCFNCEQGVSSTPCGQCQACTAIAQGRFVDLIEVDAASRTKVEDTRELLDNVQYMPTQGRYKVYLIDEVHMLSGHSFNALLKTLEEPPEYVKFILATTEADKLPVTVLSRCLRFHLKALSIETIQQQLVNVLQQEQVTYEPQALFALARGAAGSMRDGLSLLDQAIAFGNGVVKTAEVNAMLGSIDNSYLLRLLHALLTHSCAEAMAISAEMNEQAVDFSVALQDLNRYFYYLALLKADIELPEALPCTAELRQLAQSYGNEDLQLLYQISLQGYQDCQITPDAKQGFEMTLLRLLAFFPGSTETALAAAALSNDAVNTESAAVTVVAEQINTVSEPGLQGQSCQSLAAKTVGQAAEPTHKLAVQNGLPNSAGEASHRAEQAVSVSTSPHDQPSIVAAENGKARAVSEQLPTANTAKQELQTEQVDVVEQRKSVVLEDANTAAASVELGVELATHWSEVVEKLELSGMTYAVASQCIVKQVGEKSVILALSLQHAPFASRLQEEFIAEALSCYLGRQVSVTIQCEEISEQTPAALSINRSESQRSEALAALQVDSNVLQLQQAFDAQLLPKSLKINLAED